MPPIEDTPKPKRAQLKHLLLDVNFFEKPKIKALEYDYGSGGVCFFIAILCDMAKATDSEISASCIKATGRQFGFDREKAEEFLQYITKHNLIHKCRDPEYFANRRILEDQESMASKQDKWRNAKRKQRDIPMSPSGQQEDNRRTGCGPVNIEDLNNEDLNLDLKKNGVPEQQSKFLEIAEASLVSKTDPRLSTLNEFIVMGKRPMTKYPAIRLTAQELADILEQYEQAGIPIDERRIFEPAFKNVAARLKNKASGGAPPLGISAYNWLIGFAKTDLLKEYKATLDLKRSETYLEKARV